MPVITRSKDYTSHAFVRLSWEDHCSWHFLLTKEQLEFVETSLYRLEFVVGGMRQAVDWKDLIDEVITDPVKIAACVANYCEHPPEFIRVQLEELENNYPFYRFYINEQVDRVQDEFGNGMPDLKISRSGRFRDSFLEGIAQETGEKYQFIARELLEWRRDFVVYLQDQNPMLGEDSLESDEEDECIE